MSASARIAGTTWARLPLIRISGQILLLFRHPGSSRTSHRHTPGFWKRVAAWIIDIIIVYGIFFCIGVVIGLLIAGGMISAGNYSLYDYDRITETLTTPLILIGLIIFILYSAVLESSKTQATFGKRVLKIKVIGSGGSRLTFGRALARTIAKIFSAIILGLGLLIIGFTEKKQGLHDMMTGTYVIKT